MGKQKLLKLAQKLKDFIKKPTKLNCSHLPQNYMRTAKKIYVCFVPC